MSQVAKPNIVWTQMGARQSFAGAQMAHREGLLHCLITDAWNPLSLSTTALLARLGISPLCGFLKRRNDAIPRSHVVAFNGSATWAWLRSARPRQMGRNAMYKKFIAEGAHFASQCALYLGSDHTSFFGFSCASLEAMRFERKHGRRTVLDQIDAARTEDKIVCREAQRFKEIAPDWEPIPEPYFARLEEEWNEASCVLVNSLWSK